MEEQFQQLIHNCLKCRGSAAEAEWHYLELNGPGEFERMSSAAIQI